MSVVGAMSTVGSVLIAIPIGIYSATHQYTIPDYIFTFLGFIGMAVPGFLLALVFMYFAMTVLGGLAASTLISLLLRFYQASDGQVLFDGVPADAPVATMLFSRM